MSSSKKKTKAPLIKVRGTGLSIRLFRMTGLTMSPNKLVTALKGIKYVPQKGKEPPGTGFSKVSLTGKAVRADFMADFGVPVRIQDPEGGFMSRRYYAVDNGTVLLKLDRNIVEVRGSERLARRVRRVLMSAKIAQLEPLNLNGGAKKLYDMAIDVDSVLVSGISKKGNLTQAEFKGGSLQSEEEVGMYTRRYGGEVTRFRGTFRYGGTSGTELKTSINGVAGSVMIWSADDLKPKDVHWIVKLMEDSALPIAK